MNYNIIFWGERETSVGAGVAARIQSTWSAVAALALPMLAPCSTQPGADDLYNLTIITSANAQRIAISSIGMYTHAGLERSANKNAKRKP